MVSFGLPSHQIVPEIVSQIRAPLDLILDLAANSPQNRKTEKTDREDRKAYFLDRYIYIISISHFGLSYRISVDSRHGSNIKISKRLSLGILLRHIYRSVGRQGGSALSLSLLAIPKFMNQDSVFQVRRVNYLDDR